MSLKDFFKECHKRGVFKLLTLYIVTSWVILQVLSVVWQPLNLPEKSVTYLIIILLLLFPLYIFYLWKTRVRNSKSSNIKNIEDVIKYEISFKRKYFISLAVISLLSISSVALIVDNTFTNGINLTKIEESSKIAVLDFSNNTGDGSLNDIGKMAANWLIFGITENDAGEVISPEVIENYSSLLGVQMSIKETNSILKKYLNPNKVISGAYFLNNDTLILRCTIKNGTNDTTLHTFRQIECNSSSALDCIEELRQEVVGYLTSSGNPKTILEETPPKFAAFQKMLDAEAMYENPDEYIKLLNETIALDDNYFEPKIRRIQHFYNIGDYATSDSLIQFLSTGQRRSKQQLNILNFMEGIVEGNNSKAYNFHQLYLNSAPTDIVANTSQMTMAMQFVNKPEVVENLFNNINMDDFILEDCYYCKSRYFSLSSAYNRLGEYQKTIDLLEPVMFEADHLLMYRAYLSATVKSKQIEKLNVFLNRASLKSDKKDVIGMYLYAGKRFVLINEKEAANDYFDYVIDQVVNVNSNKANAYYFKEDYVNAEKAFETLLNADSSSIDFIGKLAISKFKLGKEPEAKDLINSLSNLREPYQYGSIDYAIAMYLASIGDNKNALIHLRESVAQGNFFVPGSFQNDIHFQAIKDASEFQEILTYWHKFIK